MDIKSRNKYLYFIVWALLIHLGVLAVLAAADVTKHRSYLMQNYYFESDAFHNELQLFVNLIRYVHIDNKNYPQMTPEEKVGAERMAAWKQAYEAAKQESESQIQQLYSSKMAEGKEPEKDELTRLMKERNDKLAEANQLLETRKREYVAYKDQEYADVKNSLSMRGGSLHYYIKDGNTGSIYTNMEHEPGSEEMKQSLYIVRLPQTYVEHSTLQQINKFFQQNRLEGYLLIPREAKGYSKFHADFAYFNSVRERLLKEIVLFAAALVIMAALYLLLRSWGAVRIMSEGSRPVWLLRIPVDVRLLIAFGVLLIAVQLSDSGFLFQLPLRGSQLAQWTVLSLLAAFLLLCLTDGVRLYRDRDDLREQWQSSVYKKTKVLITQQLVNRSLLFKAGIVFVLTVLLGMFVCMAVYGLAEGEGELLLFSLVYIGLFAATILPFMIRRLVMLSDIVAGADQIAEGNWNYSFKEAGGGHLARLSRQLNSMKQSFKTSLENEMKSERLKSELITNVSHDLKTPLTSIINYVDLLKQKDLPSETIESYIGVLDRKTQRLKVLIDDLFEASKMASGSVEFNVENVNVSALLEQALAEFSDKADDSGLTFRVQMQHAKISAPLDGRKTWRVFENLISNALKYAMPHTRVHLSLSEEEDNVVFTIKNVSAYEIDFEVEELFERFKRGDSSRHTEGSGLGLAIAKSIVELQGGRLLIEVDGDLFKATVLFDKKARAA